MSLWRRFPRWLKPRPPVCCDFVNSSHAWTNCTMRLMGNTEDTPKCAVIGRFSFLTLPSVRAWLKWKLGNALTLDSCLYTQGHQLFLWAPDGSSMKSEDVTSSRDMKSVKPGAAVLPFSVEALMADRTPSRVGKNAASRALWSENGSSFSYSCSVVHEGDASTETKSPERADRSSWTEESRFSPPPPSMWYQEVTNSYSKLNQKKKQLKLKTVLTQ